MGSKTRGEQNPWEQNPWGANPVGTFFLKSRPRSTSPATPQNPLLNNTRYSCLLLNNNKTLKGSKVGVFWELRDETWSKKRSRPGDFKKHTFEKWFWIFVPFLTYLPTNLPTLRLTLKLYIFYILLQQQILFWELVNSSINLIN